MISAFLGLTVALSSVFYLLIIVSGKFEGAGGRYATGIMWCPGIAALCTYLIYRVPIEEIGWSLGKTRFLAWGYFIPFIYIFVSYLIIWSTGLGGFPNPEFVRYCVDEIGLHYVPSWMEVTIFIGLQAIFGFVRSCANALGEEIGWRGLLVPQLFKKYGYSRTSLISGLIWAIWHFPVLLFADYNEGTVWWYDLTCFTVLVIAMSFILTWLRMRTGNIWSSVFLHASHNLFIQDIFSPITIKRHYTRFAADEFGFVLPVLVIIMAWWFWRHKEKIPVPT